MASPGGGAGLAYDPDGPNNADWGATTVEARDTGEMWLHVAQVPAGVVRGVVQVTAVVDGTVLPETFPFEVSEAGSIPIGLTNGEATGVLGWRASILAFDDQGRAGRPAGKLDPYTPPPPDPDPLSKVSDPVFNSDPQQAGGPMDLTPPAWSDDPDSEIVTFWGSDDGYYFEPFDAVAGQTWPLDTPLEVYVHYAAYGFGAEETPLDAYSNTISITPPPEGTDDLEVPIIEWLDTVESEYSGWWEPRFRILNDDPEADKDWATDGQWEPRPDKWEIGGVYEVETGGVYGIRMADPAKRTSPNLAERVNYALFAGSVATGLTEAFDKHTKLTVRMRKSGIDGPPTPKMTIPDPTEPPVVGGYDGGWVKMSIRTQAQYLARIVGGPGYQFIRSWGRTVVQVDYCVGAMDTGMPWATDNFFGSFYAPRWRGAYGCYSGVSIWVSPITVNRQIMMVSSQNNLGDQNFDFDGLLLSTDMGDTCDPVQQFGVIGQQNSRRNAELIAHDPTSLSAGVHVYAMQRTSNGSGGTATIQLWRSLSHGDVGTWAKRGPALDPAVFADGPDSINGIGFAADGTMFMWGDKGAWKSSDKGATSGGWTKLTALPSGKQVKRLCIGSGTGNNIKLWAAVKDNGAYYSSNSGSGFTKKLQMAGIETMSVSTVDEQLVFACGFKKGEPSEGGKVRSLNGGNTWDDIVSNPMDGQEETYESGIGREMSFFLPHFVDVSECAVCRYQHMGWSGTATAATMVVDWSGDDFDGESIRGRGYHPTLWPVQICAMQDRVSMYTDFAWLYGIGDCISKKTDVGKDVMAMVNYNVHLSGSGCAINSAGRALICVGKSSNPRAVCIIKDPENGDDAEGKALAECGWGLMAEFANDDQTIGYAGNLKVTNCNAANLNNVSTSSLGRQYAGQTADGSAIYGVANSGKVLSRSTSRGSSWSSWYTFKNSFRTRNLAYQVIAISKHHNYRAFASSGTNLGRLVRVQGTNPAANSEEVIFDARMVGRAEYCEKEIAAGHPQIRVFSIAECPLDPTGNTLYVCLGIVGGYKQVFRSRNAISGSGWAHGGTPGAGAVQWEDVTGHLPAQDGFIFTHPITGDLRYDSSHGPYGLPAPADLRAAASITPYAFFRKLKSGSTADLTGITGAKTTLFSVTCAVAGGAGVGKGEVYNLAGDYIGQATVGTPFSATGIGFTMTGTWKVGDRADIATSEVELTVSFKQGIT